MTAELVALDRAGPMLRVTLNRPQKANALNLAMVQRLLEICAACGRDPDLRALVITGAGGRVFCAGADLSEITSSRADSANSAWQRVPTALATLDILTIAAVNGPCIGGGLTLALGCDIRISVPEAHFAYPVLRNKLIPGKVDCDRLRALIGPGRTSLLLLGGQKVMAPEAKDWGLVDRIVTHGRLLQGCEEICATACAAEREHLAAIKRLCRGDLP
jgi:enoyl-CoA hydratase/carnithine racemase